MFTISYNLSTQIKAKIAKIDELSKEILLTPISPKMETKLRLHATLGHLEGWANLANQPLTHEAILDIMNRLQAKNVSPLIEKVLSYKNAVNYVRENWCGNQNQVTYDTIRELSEVLGVTAGSKEEVGSLLNYLQTGQIHPVIQAAIAHQSFYPNRLAYLISYLFLAKAGYDLRGWLSLEDCWNQNKQSFLQIMQQTSNSTNSTAWLEYFCQGLIIQMTAIKSDLTTLITSSDQNISKHLNKRQKDILDLFDQSENPVTNRQVQEAFKVSQITASRDLAKLSLAGLITPHGSGRSTAYTKI